MRGAPAPDPRDRATKATVLNNLARDYPRLKGLPDGMQRRVQELTSELAELQVIVVVPVRW